MAGFTCPTLGTKRTLYHAMMFGLMVLGLLAGCDRTPATSSQPASVPASAPASAAAGGTAAERQLRVLLLNEVRTAAIVPADSFRILDARSREEIAPKAGQAAQ